MLERQQEKQVTNHFFFTGFKALLCEMGSICDPAKLVKNLRLDRLLAKKKFATIILLMELSNETTLNDTWLYS